MYNLPKRSKYIHSNIINSKVTLPLCYVVTIKLSIKFDMEIPRFLRREIVYFLLRLPIYTRVEPQAKVSTEYKRNRRNKESTRANDALLSDKVDL